MTVGRRDVGVFVGGGGGALAAGVLTVTSTVPEPAGEVAVTCVGDSALRPVALAAPNLTSLAPVRFVPVIVTVVPPAAGPLVGSILVTVGAGMM